MIRGTILQDLHVRAGSVAGEGSARLFIVSPINCLAMVFLRMLKIDSGPKKHSGL
ncbi:hypothetical protein SBDP1_470021 [Syntrophobacter sp. SbD1]|nr:hypothetical protein SBDP1_470021 [Syntrophobacter sp. SbD1]